ncbi:tRNA-2-methylthio-N(6)-dimethylallyladenosin e synthase isoform A [Chlorella sorokiniana]|uniref:tRNA-2-methylthio-N(6)-dimethylallyladenosin e synthase isoform A n=1 Tax=Chlorella sorokiniana TaxID=3076 RepID=A0A2P6TX51_CHLSO|nr:tRNA-2-methylthio-N(6)-dimethylallyladenosin e synthase isoform A [Chlorella sorokiniana]|eukprot:PRW58645.1 tRNA-2-methylthio-N(6)-dimethylallyladenosin e synthase isoform A [Chlorella sorokiniana]
MSSSRSSKAAALCLLALMAICACQGALARELPAEAAAAAPASAAEDVDSGLAPVPAPALDLTVDDGSALLGSNRDPAECGGPPICDCELYIDTEVCDQRCEQIATKFAYDVWRKIYLEDCKQRCEIMMSHGGGRPDGIRLPDGPRAPQGALARELPAEAAAAAPASAAEDVDSGLAPAPAPAMDLTVDDGTALLGSAEGDCTSCTSLSRVWQ